MYDVIEFNRRLSDLMKKKRKEIGMTQKTLSYKTEIDLKYLQKLESKKVIIEPKLKTLNCLAETLGISLYEMLMVLLDEESDD